MESGGQQKRGKKDDGVNLKHEKFSMRLGDVQTVRAFYEMAKGAHDPLLPFSPAPNSFISVPEGNFSSV